MAEKDKFGYQVGDKITLPKKGDKTARGEPQKKGAMGNPCGGKK